MKRNLSFLLLFFPYIFTYGQEYSNKPVTVAEDTFLPYLKGKVSNGIHKNDANFQRIFGLLQSAEALTKPQGYEVKTYSDGENSTLAIDFIPYKSEKNETVRAKTASSLTIFLNDIMAMWQPIDRNTPGIYSAPVKVADFIGYPIYRMEGVEKTIIYKGAAPLFLPVSREEYLMALIKSEEAKQKNNGRPKPPAEISSEIEKTYQELLKTDKAAAEEFKQQMKSFKTDMAEYERNKPDDPAASYRKELNRLSPTERKQQAYYAIYAPERYGNLSGLVPQGKEGNAAALVKPNDKAFPTDSRDIHLIVLNWNLISTPKSEENSPRLYKPQNSFGYSLTDDKMYELYNNHTLWENIIGLIK